MQSIVRNYCVSCRRKKFPIQSEGVRLRYTASRSSSSQFQLIILHTLEYVSKFRVITLQDVESVQKSLVKFVMNNLNWKFYKKYTTRLISLPRKL